MVLEGLPKDDRLLREIDRVLRRQTEYELPDEISEQTV